MSRLKQTGACALLLLAAALGSCADDDPDKTPSDGSAPTNDGGVQTDAGRDAGGMDATTPDATIPGSDGGTPATLASCIDRPTDLPRPPEGRLTCDLLPPGLTLPL